MVDGRVVELELDWFDAGAEIGQLTSLDQRGRADQLTSLPTKVGSSRRWRKR